MKPPRIDHASTGNQYPQPATCISRSVLNEEGARTLPGRTFACQRHSRDRVVGAMLQSNGALAPPSSLTAQPPHFISQPTEILSHQQPLPRVPEQILILTSSRARTTPRTCHQCQKERAIRRSGTNASTRALLRDRSESVRPSCTYLSL